METNIYNLIGKVLSGEATETEHLHIDKWRSESKDNQILFDDIKSDWKNGKSMPFPEFSTEAALNDLHSQMDKNTISRNITPWTRIAAILILGIVLGVSVPKVLKQINEPRYVSIHVEKGEKIDIQLNENLKVWLNSDSEIKYSQSFDEDMGEIILKGEAYFEYNGNYTKPILIKSGSSIITCMEGNFNIKAREPNKLIELDVEQGWLAISNTQMSDETESIIAKGEKGIIAENVIITNEKIENRNYLAWKTGELVFDNCPMYKVAEVLSDYYQKPFEIEGEMKYCKFSSSYKDPTINKVIRDIEASFNAKSDKSDKKIKLSGKEC